MFRMMKEFMLAPLTIDALTKAYIITCLIVGIITLCFTVIKCIIVLKEYEEEQRMYERLRKNGNRHKT